jgi:hypothetical protein
VAVHEGYCLNKSIRSAAYGGHQLSKEINRVLSEKTENRFLNKYAASDNKFTQSFLDFHQQVLLGDVKEALSVRRQEETGGDTLVTNVEYELPDHRTITINRS